MKTYNRQLKKQIERSKKILILTHKGPDMDAFCSMLLMYSAINQIYPKKEISLQARQMPTMKIPQMGKIDVVKKVDTQGYDLIIIVDAYGPELCFEEGDTIDGKNIIAIDHHISDGGNQGKFLIINELLSSATEQVYTSCIDMFGRRFKLNKDTAELVQAGIVADTGRFLYSTTTTQTLRIYADAKDISSVDLETFAYKFSKFPKEATPAVIEYLKTLTIKGDMAYMSISMETIEKMNLEKKGVNEAQAFLRDKYIRYIQGVHWGFIVKPDFDTKNKWYVSFRSGKGYKDVGKIAEKLGGGGHMYSSGVPIMADTSEIVVKKVLDAIHQS